MKNKENECWKLARQFELSGDADRSVEAAELGHRFASLGRKPRKVDHDHEGRMAVGELSSLMEDVAELQKLIGKDDELPGWVSSYITLAADYMHSVAQYMRHEDSEEE